MKQQTEPFAYGLLAALSFLWFMFTVIACCGSCAGSYVPLETRPLEARDTTTVKIEMLCISSNPFTDDMTTIGTAFGSGVVLGGKKVLTANHVVECKYLADIHVVFADKTRVKARLEKAWPDRDIAKLVLETDTGLPNVDIASAKTGTKVCVSAAAPEREQNCGGLEMVYGIPVCQPSSRGGTWCYSMSALIGVIPGNSGSGVYDEQGRLVALATGGSSFMGMPVPIGYLTALEPVRAELLK